MPGWQQLPSPRMASALLAGRAASARARYVGRDFSCVCETRLQIWRLAGLLAAAAT